MGIEFPLTNDSIHAILQALTQTTERIMTPPDRNKYHRDAMEAVEYGDGDYYVYVYFREDNGFPCYVGKGSKNGSYNRLNTKERNSYFQNVVNKYGATVKVIRNCGKNEKLSHDYEKELVALFRRIGFELTNLTDGGEGASGYNHSDEAKQKISETKSGERNPNWGKSTSYETKQRMSEANSGENNPFWGRTHSAETKKKISNNRADFSGENNPRFKGFSIGYNESKIVILCGAIEMKSRGFLHSKISQCVNGIRNYHKGHQWIRTDSPADIYPLLEGREFADEESRVHWEYFQVNYL